MPSIWTDDLDPVDARVGARIRARRQELGLTQDVLASELKITFQQLQKYERGINRVAASRLFHLARLLQVEAAYFFDEPDRRTSVEDEGVAFLDIAREEDALRLNAAFRRIDNPALKRAVVTLVENIAAVDREEPAPTVLAAVV